jgi:hypothetical protein
MGIQISYGSSKLKGCCLVLEKAEQVYGRTLADRLTTAIAEAEAFDNAEQWRDFLGEDMVSTATKSFQVSFGSVYVASFAAIDNYQTVSASGHVDWSTVEYLKLTEISGQQ